MFQYAFGYALQKTKETKLLLDIAMYDKTQTHYGFELSRIFLLETQVASKRDVRKVLGWRATSLGRELMARNRFRFLNGDKYIREQRFLYDDFLSSPSSNCYYTGYWQSELYFLNYHEEIREAFRFRPQMSSENSALTRKIDSCESISIHIRRGDSLTKGVMASCSPEYYSRAMALLNNRVDKPIYFIFSDDIDWARSNIRNQSECHFVDHNVGMESYNDMRLMSHCKHNIIANSSFSWWGAWLNDNPNKFVVAPSKWFKEEIPDASKWFKDVALDLSTLIPKTWELI